MTMFIGDNPVIMSGSVVAKRKEKIVLGDGRGNTLIFDWANGNSGRAHGSPSDVIIDLPLEAGQSRSSCSVQVHIEGKPVLVRYVVERFDDEFCVISYTICEDIRELYLESEAPALAHKDASEGVRLGMGPDSD
jgi:hypothetical protein